MVSIPGLFFVLAADGRARFVRPDPENGLHTIEVVDFAGPRQRDDDPSAGPVARTDPPGPHESEPGRFARLLAPRLDEDFAVDLFSHLVLVAPPDVLRAVMAAIDTPTRAGLFGSLAKDLMPVPDLELWPHLLPWLQPAPASWVPSVPLTEW
jgi:protein required for attachment to host cells